MAPAETWLEAPGPNRPLGRQNASPDDFDLAKSMLDADRMCLDSGFVVMAHTNAYCRRLTPTDSQSLPADEPCTLECWTDLSLLFGRSFVAAAEVVAECRVLCLCFDLAGSFDSARRRPAEAPVVADA